MPGAEVQDDTGLRADHLRDAGEEDRVDRKTEQRAEQADRDGLGPTLRVANVGFRIARVLN